MDDIVRQALAKWPNVPHCYGWLGMDARGDYYMRDDACQAAGAFQTYRSNANAKGSRIQHDKLLAFIHRNYTHDERGAYFFQNGPQRVYVELELAPYVWRVEPNGHVMSHTGENVTVQGMYLTTDDMLMLVTPLGAGNVHPQDIFRASELLSDVPRIASPLHGWVSSPQML
jgi:Protein of unknown function (DUF2946)